MRNSLLRKGTGGGGTARQSIALANYFKQIGRSGAEDRATTGTKAWDASEHGVRNRRRSDGYGAGCPVSARRESADPARHAVRRGGGRGPPPRPAASVAR